MTNEAIASTLQRNHNACWPLSPRQADWHHWSQFRILSSTNTWSTAAGSVWCKDPSHEWGRICWVLVGHSPFICDGEHLFLSSTWPSLWFESKMTHSCFQWLLPTDSSGLLQMDKTGRIGSLGWAFEGCDSDFAFWPTTTILSVTMQTELPTIVCLLWWTENSLMTVSQNIPSF